MTGNFSLTLPIMLAAGLAAAVSKRLSYGSIYTTKLLRRGIDIERPKLAIEDPGSHLQDSEKPPDLTAPSVVPSFEGR